MGSFIGHAVPGIMFIGFSTWWLISIIRTWLESRCGNKKYLNSASFRSSCTRRVHLEAILKLILISVGVAGEAVTGLQGGQFVELGNAQHMAMFLFFLLNAVVDILYFHRPQLLPPGLDYMTAILGFSMEGFLFVWHLHGRSEIDVQVHTFLLYLIVLSAALTLAEYLCRENVLFGLGRSFATFLQGTWLCQIGFILNNPIGEAWPNTHDQLTLNTVVFTAHIAGALLVQLTIGWLLYRCVESSYPDLLVPKNVRFQTRTADSGSEEEVFLSSSTT